MLSESNTLVVTLVRNWLDKHFPRRRSAMSESPGAAADSAAATVSRRRAPALHEVYLRRGPEWPQSDAATVADVLVWADLRGVDSHGVSRISMYLRLIDDGDLNMTPAMKIATETAAVCAGRRRSRRRTGRDDRGDGRGRSEGARDAGIGLALVQATTHTAALAYYTLMARARKGWRRSRSPPRVPSWRTTARAPPACRRARSRSRCPAASTGPMVISTCRSGVVARGKLVQAQKDRAGRFHAGWALDRAGNPTTDPKERADPAAGGRAEGLGALR